MHNMHEKVLPGSLVMLAWRIALQMVTHCITDGGALHYRWWRITLQMVAHYITDGGALHYRWWVAHCITDGGASIQKSVIM